MNTALSIRQQKFVTLSAFTTTGDLVQLADEINAALDAGITVNEIKEIFVHLYAYCGFGRSISGTNTLAEVINRREERGIIDAVGREASAIKDTRSRYERGEQVQAFITGLSPEELKSRFAFSPRTDQFLKEHLFADIFGSDVLTYAERETLTITASVIMEGIELMAQGHILAGFNAGLTEPELRGLMSVVKDSIGKERAEIGNQLLDNAIAIHENSLND